MPELSVRIDFEHDVNPAVELPDPTWTDITNVLVEQPVSIHRGRERSLDRNEAGTVSFGLWDPDEDFDPDNDASPYFPNVVPMRRLNIGALIETSTTPFITGYSDTGGTDVVGGGESSDRIDLFDGLIESFRFSYPGPGFMSMVQVQASDWLGALAREHFTLDVAGTITNPGHPDQQKASYSIYSQNRIHYILDQKPFASRRGFGYTDDYLGGTGHSNVIDVDSYTDANMLDAISEAAQIDGGSFFSARDGSFTYRDPETQYLTLDERFTFSTEGELFTDVAFIYDETTIYNDIRITAPGFGTSQFTNEASIDRYFARMLSISLPFGSGDEITERGQDLLRRYAEPRKVIQRLDLLNTTVDWALVLGVELWDKVLVVVRLPSGATREQLSLVEGIEITTPVQGDWRVSWWLSAAPFANIIDEETATLATGIGTWEAETNCTISNDTNSLHIEALSLGDVEVRTGIYAVESRVDYRATALASCHIQGVSSTLSAHIEIEWLDDAESVLSTTVGDTVQIRSTRMLEAEARSPDTATKVRIRVVVEDLPESIGIGFEGAFVDDVKLYRSR